jgi:hypothetical protein
MKKLLLLITLVAGVIAFALPAQATILTFGLDFEFSGATPPESLVTPWLTAEFNDGNKPGSVTLTMVATNLTDAKYVNNWFFNFEDAIDVNELTISHVSGVNATVLQDPKKNEYKAAGDGLFDLLFDFPQPNNPDDLRFGVGDTAEFSIKGTGITANSFNLLSETKPNKTGYLSAAHIGGIGLDDDDSGWIGDGGFEEWAHKLEGSFTAGDGSSGGEAPEPATMLLLGSGLIGIAVSGKKRFKKRNG